MRKKMTLILSLTLISAAATAQTTTAPDPLTQILDKLNSMEQRLDKLENTAPPKSQAQTAPAVTKAPSNTQSVSQQTASTSNPKDELTGGMIVKIKHADAKKDNWMTTGISEEHFAGFVTDKSEFSTKEIQNKSLKYKGAYALTAEGFLNATEDGTYSFGLLHQQININLGHHKTTCLSSISLDGTELIQLRQSLHKNKKSETTMLVNGSASLEKGIYEYKVFSACDDHEKESYFDKSITRTFLIKTPSDLSMRPITSEEILHKK